MRHVIKTLHSYKIIPQVSQAYEFDVDKVLTSYILSYRDQAAIVSKKLSDGGVKNNSNTGILVELNKASLVIYDSKIVKIKMPWPFPKLSVSVPDFDDLKETLLGDPTLKLKPFEDSANNYWIESNPGNLKFTKSKLGIDVVQFKQADLAAKLFEPMIFSYLANTFPYALVDIRNSPERKNNFPIYQKDWKQEDSVVVYSTSGTPKKASVYNRYTKPALRKELEEIQSTDNNKQVEDVNKEMKDFIKIRKDFLG